jgi:hypothetical protein
LNSKKGSSVKSDNGSVHDSINNSIPFVDIQLESDDARQHPNQKDNDIQTDINQQNLDDSYEDMEEEKIRIRHIPNRSHLRVSATGEGGPSISVGESPTESQRYWIWNA